ncbi:hypothetical protein [Acetilactobacillus jinshanensis]|uniref:Aggregation promoting factor surface protein n=1 Tax=Acetilactobacillus jinshanensis TaxID=1720083 RepID=A0A4P6ZK99_9LACO|nr:hypothetical protein [Acetilactobacillus jinshanensis]QBP18191.1 hypothetical protein ELX58_03355 [Acetilactobacillus jinshanensis]URL61059.1 hypothetical protein HGK75_03420 [uncultured bacterium]
MESLVKDLSSKKSKTLIFYVVYIVLISVLLFIGLSGNIHADTANSQQNSSQQYQNQNNTTLVQQTKQQVNHNQQSNNDWFRDGLNNNDYSARSWVSWHESGHRWNILSYGHRCIGYFQLDPNYLGYKHGHVNLDHKHQVKVADAYAKSRYGSWVNAKKFWQAHRWY